jgi:hypothetical protein
MRKSLLFLALVAVFMPFTALMAQPSGCCTVKAASLSMDEDGKINIDAAGRLALQPIVLDLRKQKQDRLVIAFRPSAKNLEAATLLFTVLKRVGLDAERMRMITQDTPGIEFPKGETLSLIRIPAGQPIPGA